MPLAYATVILLVVIALCSAWIAAVVPIEQSVTHIDTEGKYVMTLGKTSLYYVAHGLAIGSVIAAGILAALLGGIRILGAGARAALFVVMVTAAVWAYLSFTPEEILSSIVFGATGPFVWLTLLFVIAGTDRRVWAVVDPTIRLLAYVSTLLAFRTLLSSEYRYYAGFSPYLMYAQLLVWLGGWTLLSATQLRGARVLVRAIPLLTALLMAICSQSRSWTLLAFLLTLAFAMLRSRERESFASGVNAFLASCALCAGAIALVGVTSPYVLKDGMTGLAARLEEDSRTGQYRAFFNVVPVTDLLLGRGPKGTWYWNNVGEYQFFDNGYVWTLFVGGVPMLIGYSVVLLWPSVQALRARPVGADAAAVCLVLTWTLALTGLSTFCLPSIGINNFLVSLWAGRCHLLLAERAWSAQAALPLASQRRSLGDRQQVATNHESLSTL